MSAGPACSLKVLPKPGAAATLLHRCYASSVLSYDDGARLMDRTVRTFLDYKLHQSRLHAASPPPAPTLLTFEFAPTYTLGRRERGSLTPALQAQLSDNGAAQVVPTFRGGQTTFHGPGQLVAYPIIDLRSFAASTDPAGLPVRCYVELLERCVINMLRNTYGIAATTTENTGVWVDEGHKICALGIHVRRHVTSHGIALNVATDTHRWFDRIVACGLPDKQTTSIAEQLKNSPPNLTVKHAAHAFAEEFAQSLGLNLQEEYL